MKRMASVALLLLLTVCGCGSGGSGKPTPGSPSTSASGAAAPSTTATDDDASGGGNPVDGPTFCAFLTTEEPRLKSTGSAAGAEATFAIDLATWIGDHPKQKPRTSKDLDDASQKSCPKTRTAAVKDLGASSFADVL